jgi:hypothetical protein
MKKLQLDGCNLSAMTVGTSERWRVSLSPPCCPWVSVRLLRLLGLSGRKGSSNFAHGANQKRRQLQPPSDSSSGGLAFSYCLQLIKDSRLRCANRPEAECVSGKPRCCETRLLLVLLPLHGLNIGYILRPACRPFVLD